MSNPLQELKDLKAELLRELPTQSAHIIPRPRRNSGSNELRSPIHSDELQYLNAHWGDWDHVTPYTSHRPIFGRFLASIKNRVRSYLLRVILGEYLDSEREFNASVVRYLNEITRYVDDRSSELFRTCNEKIDIESRHESARQDVLFTEIVRMIEKRSEELESKITALEK